MRTILEEEASVNCHYIWKSSKPPTEMNQKIQNLFPKYMRVIAIVVVALYYYNAIVVVAL